MKNRRYDYRHTFEPADRLHVEVVTEEPRCTVVGRVVNLCVAGMSLELGADAPPLGQDDHCQASFSLPRQTHRFALDSLVVHSQSTGEGGQLGLRFLPLPDQEAHDERERALWLYLLDEQRRAIRRARGR